MRASMGGVTGIDLVAALSIGRSLGYDIEALAELLPFGEAGMILALNKPEDEEA
jgi:hypothetical protein